MIDVKAGILKQSHNKNKGERVDNFLKDSCWNLDFRQVFFILLRVQAIQFKIQEQVPGSNSTVIFKKVRRLFFSGAYDIWPLSLSLLLEGLQGSSMNFD